VRALCVHGHFYQPPREDPWTGEVPHQPSASPHHDWNARINAECYTPCALTPSGPPSDLNGWVNLYKDISFDIGPTLVDWLRAHAPDTWSSILQADADSARRLGHGNAIAQVYNHLIMPLANARDQRTQIHWGVRHFAHHFGRSPVGMWLAETAVDIPTLEALVDQGVSFTILSPTQAARTRAARARRWRDVAADGAGLDTTQAYWQRLPSGRRIALIFYDGALSAGMAFGGLLRDGRALSRFVNDAFTPPTATSQAKGRQRARAQRQRLLCAASDGETYGHHWRRGDEALAQALTSLRAEGVEVTNAAAWLAQHPPTAEVEVRARTAWSCSHGLGRWTTDCGCRMNGAWHQRWRAPLRDAIDAVRDRIARDFARMGEAVFLDPWGARDGYIDALLQPEAAADWLSAQLQPNADEKARAQALALLEAQRFAMLMYTSCGWFFDEVSGLETMQCLRYAARACERMDDAAGAPLGIEAQLLEALSAVPSNLHSSARPAYEQLVRAEQRVTPSPPLARARVAAAEAQTLAFYDGELTAIIKEMAHADDKSSALLRAVAEAALNARLCALIGEQTPDPQRVEGAIKAIEAAHVVVHQEPTRHALDEALNEAFSASDRWLKPPQWLLGLLRIGAQPRIMLDLRPLQRRAAARHRRGEGVAAPLLAALGLSPP
jgi:alpha-amylase/alpha-mannosidase (GH57 family)